MGRRVRVGEEGGLRSVPFRYIHTYCRSDRRERERERVDTRRGTIRYVGPVPEIPSSTNNTTTQQETQGDGSWWVGIELDEPVGKNDGSVAGKRYFDLVNNTTTTTTTDDNKNINKRGVFVRPERCQVGDFPVLTDVLTDEDLEEM